jgi:Uma2 family endonuclease
MAQDTTIAPWAELVPPRPSQEGIRPMTVDDLLALPDDDGWQYELVEGRLVRMPPPGGEHGNIAGNIFGALWSFVTARRLGRVLAAETCFQLGPDTVLAADAAFVRAARLPARDSAEWKRYWQLAPDLVAEVASPSQKRADLEAKARTWLAAGVRLVWIAWPDTRQVDVWRPTDTSAPALTLGVADTLDGLDVLPGFTYALAELFA